MQVVCLTKSKGFSIGKVYDIVMHREMTDTLIVLDNKGVERPISNDCPNFEVL